MEQNHHHAQHGSALRAYVHVVRRRKWIILPALLLVPLAAVLLSLQQERLYEAHAQVLLSHQNLAAALTGTPDQSAGVTPDREAQTQAALARVHDVAAATLASAGVRRPASALLARSSVSAKTNADLLDFSVTDDDPVLAAVLATAYAKQYTLYRQRLDTAALQRARGEIQQRLTDLTGGQGIGALYRDLVQKDQELATMEALQTANASLVQPAPGAAQVQPTPLRNAILGLALGLVLGLGLAFLWEALDTRVRSTEEIAERLGLPLLVRLPEPPRPLRKKEQLVMLAESRGTGAEVFRMLRTNLEFVRLGHEAKTIMITSAVAQEGKSTTVANLAVALARAGERVALVDLDLRRPFLDHFFDLRDRPGLTQVAIGEVGLDDALAQVAIGEHGNGNRPGAAFMQGATATGAAATNGAVANGHDPGEVRRPTTRRSLHDGSLSVLVAGPIPPNCGEFAGSDSVAGILLELRDRFDTVLIDAPPVLQVGDAMALSANLDAVLVVTRMKVIRRPMLTELRRQLDASPARKLGFIVTDAESEQGDGYGAGYYGYGSYAPAKEPVGAAT